MHELNIVFYIALAITAIGVFVLTCLDRDGEMESETMIRTTVFTCIAFCVLIFCGLAKLILFLT